MLKRGYYLNQLIKSKDLNLIKVITGVRRSGKSTLLLQYKDYLLSQKISEKSIIYMNFENAYFIYRVPRYELKGKQLLKTQRKYYFVDNDVIDGLSSYDSGSSFENLIYIELLRRRI